MTTKQHSEREVYYREAHNYLPRDAQGTIVEEIHDYAKTQIPEDEATRTRCGTFRELTFVCDGIAAIEGIPKSKVYPALRMIGYNDRYRNYKAGNPDLLVQMAELVKRCNATMEEAIQEQLVDENKLFNVGNVVMYRMSKPAMAIAGKNADLYSIRTAELNMFNVLRGIEVLVETEPTYMLVSEKDVMKRTLERFFKLKKRIELRIKFMEVMLC